MPTLERGGRLPEWTLTLGRASLSIVLALAIAGAVLGLLGYSPWLALSSLLRGALGSQAAWTATLLKTTPLLLTGLAVALSFRAGVWNIGAEGQFYLGALFATAMATRFGVGLPAPLLIPLVILSGLVAGAAWSSIAGLLLVKRGVSEVISTILLNFVAIQLVSLAVHGPLQEAAGAYPQSELFPSASRLPAIGRIHVGIVLALASAGFAAWLVFRTAVGFRIRAVGLSPRASGFAGILPDRTKLTALALGGGFAGLAGAIEVAGVTGRLFERLSPGYGYTAIAVALLARLNPLAVIAAAFLFGILEAGGGSMQRSAGVPAVATDVVKGVVILLSIGFALGRDRPVASRPEEDGPGQEGPDTGPGSTTAPAAEGAS